MFSQTAEYALRAMACLSLTPGQRVSTAVIARQARIPPNYLSKVLQQLGAAGLVSGRRGVGGGYQLARNAADVNLMQVIGAVDRLDRVADICPLMASDGQSCPLHRASERAAAAAFEVLAGTTLQDLMRDVQDGHPLCSQSMSIEESVRAETAAPVHA